MQQQTVSVGFPGYKSLAQHFVFGLEARLRVLRPDWEAIGENLLAVTLSEGISPLCEEHKQIPEKPMYDHVRFLVGVTVDAHLATERAIAQAQKSSKTAPKE
jgi:hypothetical protein